ncbi:hypothetical protein MKW92_019508 [Papaver armeniacum]|nr:hypothetical protein MKW92_019508 [Papaver armeniacum]
MSPSPPSADDGILLNLIVHLSKSTKTNTFIRTIRNHGFPLVRGESLYLRSLFEQRLREWIHERLEEECTTGTLNVQGLGVIHMLAIMGYNSHIRMYYDLGRGKLSLDFPDLKGWTALHWAAFFNRNSIAQLLLDMGANPTLLTRRTMEFPSGLTAAEVAWRNGHHKLASYLTNVTKEYLHQSNVTALDASSSQVQMDAKNRTKMGGKDESKRASKRTRVSNKGC